MDKMELAIKLFNGFSYRDFETWESAPKYIKDGWTELAVHVLIMIENSEKEQRESCADELEKVHTQDDCEETIVEKLIHSWRTSR